MKIKLLDSEGLHFKSCVKRSLANPLRDIDEESVGTSKHAINAKAEACISFTLILNQSSLGHTLSYAFKIFRKIIHVIDVMYNWIYPVSSGITGPKPDSFPERSCSQ